MAASEFWDDSAKCGPQKSGEGRKSSDEIAARNAVRDTPFEDGNAEGDWPGWTADLASSRAMVGDDVLNGPCILRQGVDQGIAMLLVKSARSRW
jgi:enolase